MQGAPGVVGASLFFVIWLLMMTAGLVGYVILLVAVWRGMKAHESIADTLKYIAANLESRA